MRKLNLRSRRGVLFITRCLIEEHLNELHELFKWLEFIPLDGRANFDMDNSEIIGLSPRFDVVAEGEMAPQYTPTMEHKDGKVYFTLDNGVTNLPKEPDSAENWEPKLTEIKHEVYCEDIQVDNRLLDPQEKEYTGHTSIMDTTKRFCN